MPAHDNLGAARSATLCLINNERASRGFAPLAHSGPLAKVAQRYSRLMVRQRFFSHVSPSGSTLIGRVRRQTTYLHGARRWALGENIGWGWGARGTPAGAVAAWMASPLHRGKILRRDFRSLGIGVARGAPLQSSEPSAATYTAAFGRRS